MFKIEELPWLPEPSPDFSKLCRAAADLQDGQAAQLQHLATHAHSFLQTQSLSRALRKLSASEGRTDPLSRLRLAVLSNATTDTFEDYFRTAAARHGVLLDLVPGGFDQVEQQVLDPASPVFADTPDAVLLALDYRWFSLDRPAYGADARSVIEAARGRLVQVVDGIRERCNATVILQSLATPPVSSFGSFDRVAEGTARSMIATVNEEIARIAGQPGCCLLDVEHVAAQVGAARWFDPVQWAGHKIPVSADCVPLYADHLGRLLAALRGKSRKCLVLDLDFTCWGGAVGDEGVEGIVLGPGSALGEAYLEVQKTAGDLRRRGIVLAVVSKNNDDVARSAFRNHPEMHLKESDIAVFQANWQDKASNIEQIAATLNLGLDAFVMLDDNPAERAQIRAALPMVGIPDLPSDPSYFPWFLQAAGYFEAISFSREDVVRAESYTAEAMRLDVRSKSRDIGEYLKSLQMQLELTQFNDLDMKRTVQLINKTNQFNLTTRRYTEAETVAMQNDPDVVTLQARVSDKFGEMGLIGIIIARPDGSDGATLDIDTWLMSCRALGRKVEEAMLEALADIARQKGFTRLAGTYVPTAKNGMVAEHYPKLGFAPIDENAAGDKKGFVLDLEAYEPADLPFDLTWRS
ncbi:MAG: HAD-IIIC family phosphatase [Minwuia sp.]|uniref:HAD-IIIC family phosphatase n=1 Tax=Minwuia sp. TaxID=2493630 RepID=UPI003A89BCDF